VQRVQSLDTPKAKELNRFLGWRHPKPREIFKLWGLRGRFDKSKEMEERRGEKRKKREGDPERP